MKLRLNSMDSHQLMKKKAFGFFLLLVLGAIFSMVPFGMRTVAASNPPVGTAWEETVQLNSGAPGEVNVTWSVSIESANNQTVSLRFVKTAPMAIFGLLLGAIAVSPSRVFIAFTIVAILTATASLVRTRTLWDS